jgi:hypothetical protein
MCKTQVAFGNTMNTSLRQQLRVKRRLYTIALTGQYDLLRQEHLAFCYAHRYAILQRKLLVLFSLKRLSEKEDPAQGL